jgi:hypothetical protein
MTSGSMPTPVSRTKMAKVCGAGFTDEIEISPSSRVNLIAFFNRFQMICWNFVVSAAT